MDCKIQVQLRHPTLFVPRAASCVHGQKSSLDIHHTLQCTVLKGCCQHRPLHPVCTADLAQCLAGLTAVCGDSAASGDHPWPATKNGASVSCDIVMMRIVFIGFDVRPDCEICLVKLSPTGPVKPGNSSRTASAVTICMCVKVCGHLLGRGPGCCLPVAAHLLHHGKDFRAQVLSWPDVPVHHLLNQLQCLRHVPLPTAPPHQHAIHIANCNVWDRTL